MFARMALPTLGGAPSVWNTALVFYQGTLLLGYLYAHWASKAISNRRLIWVHAVVLLLALVSLPIRLPMIGRPPTSGSPILWLLTQFTVGIGLPFFAVSTTSPLIQRWFSHIGHRQSDNPYFLYAASNLGSLLALILYPILVEPQFKLAEQSLAWSMGYGLLILLIVSCMVLVVRKDPEIERHHAESQPKAESILIRRRFRWILLAFVPSSLLMGVTTHITTEIAAVPLLWVLPLSIFLLTFIFCFSDRQLIKHRYIRAALPIFVGLPLLVTIGGFREPKWIAMLIGFVSFFVCTMFCHGELAKDRPSPARLTDFYLTISLGGVLGGLFCGFVAPIIFKQVYEYPLTLVLCAALIPSRGSRTYIFEIPFPILTALAGVLSLLWLKNTPNWNEYQTWRAMIAPLIFAILSFGSPVRLSLSIATLAMVPLFFGPVASHRVYQSRSFFGTIIVREFSQVNMLSHGTTLHGEQWKLPFYAKRAVSYYSESGPVGDIFLRRAVPRDASVGVVGLGVGTLTAYSQPDQSWFIFEIDPNVVKVASDPKYFTYLQNSASKPQIVLGDARLTMSSLDQKFDYIFLDAYSSDAVPIHLITKEAFSLYKSKLKPGGLIAVHVSNRYMNLWPVVTRNGNELGMIVRRRHDGDIFGDPTKNASEWLILVNDVLDLGNLRQNKNWEANDVDARFKTWTDDRSSILEVLKGSPFNICAP